MNTSEAGSWTLAYNVNVLGSNGSREAAAVMTCRKMIYVNVFFVKKGS